jgi:hypothetical protein
MCGEDDMARATQQGQHSKDNTARTTQQGQHNKKNIASILPRQGSVI